MAEGKKYGAFAGVFTPSLLTILGVIMYMRLGWVVGQAGLIYTLVIISLAHIISITTGLSISSIATDKKIKTGGIYYILSRSLGLPMGGAIGIALFIGTALSISLYIVGFAENFLSIEAISNFTGLEADVNGFRIAGTIVIIILVIIAFISTSLALKMQFFILVAIGLSLLSIALGFMGTSEFHATSPTIAAGDEFPIEYIFAIFFPAVTGFTAGVAMSGDLQDPKKDIPVGTIWSVAVGFVVYITLAVSIAYFIDRDYLVSDNNILVKIAWSGPLVIAGIWGATLSSALGGILGGPRILQAISKDEITPKIFGKGHGPDNEPRNALLLIFAIAEGGILIGNLNVIAGIVSMFYLASYGFINLAYVLEKWASTDFRPSFKINIGFGIVGFIFSFAIMFKLDMLSMFASLLIIGGIYFYLKRKQLKTEYGDVWQSVWTTITRRALHKMDNTDMEERNWKPNIILFSGGTGKRPYLLSFGKFIVGKYGILSNFDLHENKDSKLLFTKYEQSVTNGDDMEGVFTRRQSCKDIYQGIEMIAQTYGFSGVEPNTVLMGWGRQSKDPVRFVKMINTISELDLNLVLVDYDSRYGFGEKKQIDIWWRGAGNHGNLALTLTKFISLSDDWEGVKVRLLIVNYEDEKSSLIKKKSESYLEVLRIDAQVKIINNEIEKKPFYDLMRIESAKADIVFLGFSEIKEGGEKEFVERMNSLLHDIGTVVLVKASTQFKEMHLGINQEVDAIDATRIKIAISDVGTTEKLDAAKNSVIAEKIQNIHDDFVRTFRTHNDAYLDPIILNNHKMIEQIKGFAIKALSNIKADTSLFKKGSNTNSIIENQTDFLHQVNNLIKSTNKDLLQEKEVFADNIKNYLENIEKVFHNIPIDFNIKYFEDDLKINEEDDWSLKNFKRRKQLFSNDKGANYSVKLNKIITRSLASENKSFLYQSLKGSGLVNAQFILALEKVISEINMLFKNSLRLKESDELTKKSIDETIGKIEPIFAELENFNVKIKASLTRLYTNFYAKEFNKIVVLVDNVDCNQNIPSSDRFNSKAKTLVKKSLAVPDQWAFNQNLLYNAASVNTMLLILSDKLKSMFDEYYLEINKNINTKVIAKYESYLHEMETNDKEIETDALNAAQVMNTFYTNEERLNKTLGRIIAEFPEEIEVFNVDDLTDFEEVQYEGIQPIKVSSLRLIEYIIKQELSADWNNYLDNIKNSIEKSIQSVNDGLKLLAFESDEDKIHEKKNKELLREQQHENIRSEIARMKELTGDVRNEMHRLLSELYNKLNYHSFIKIASDLKRYVKKEETFGKGAIIKRKINTAGNYFNKKYTHLLYATSDANTAEQIPADTPYSRANNILDFVLSVSPDDKIVSQLPFYYPRLFTKTTSNYKEFWFGRELEVQQADNTIERYFKGYTGAIGVIGKPGSGKSFFAKYICRNIERGKIHTVIPPQLGSTAKKDFSGSLTNATGIKGTPEKIFSQLAAGDVIVIDDLELWWENTPNGSNLVDYIFELINKFSDKILFVVIANEFLADTIFDTREVSELFINIIKLRAQNAETLKDIILTRHKAGTIELHFKGKNLETLSETAVANLFLKFAKHSYGNINTVLNLWLSSIDKYEDNTIDIVAPEVDVTLLENISIDNLITIAQFVLHKHITVTKLKKVLHEDTVTIESKLRYLLRTGIIIRQNNYYSLNPFMSIYLVHLLKSKKIL